MLEAANGRFFISKEQLAPVVHRLYGQAEFALLSLKNLQAVRLAAAQHEPDVTSLEGIDIEGLLHEIARLIPLENARVEIYFENKPNQEMPRPSGLLADKGAVWRRATDRISEEFALRFPNRTIGRLLLGAPEFYTDHYKLYGAYSFEKIAYYSLLTQAEMDEGVRIARESEWERLLEHIRDQR